MNKKGFTLIEILVVVVVISIFSGLSMLYYNNFNEQKKLESEGEGFKSIFELVRNKSLSGDKSSCSTLSADLQPFEIRYVSGLLGYYTINNDCGTPSEIARYQLKKNIVFISSGTIQFKIAQPGISNSQTIILKNSQTNKCSTIRIDLSGVVNQTNVVNCSDGT